MHMACTLIGLLLPIPMLLPPPLPMLLSHGLLAISIFHLNMHFLLVIEDL